MNTHVFKDPIVVALFVLIVGVMLIVTSGTADARDPCINQPGAVGNEGRDPGINQPGSRPKIPGGRYSCSCRSARPRGSGNPTPPIDKDQEMVILNTFLDPVSVTG